MTGLPIDAGECWLVGDDDRFGSRVNRASRNEFQILWKPNNPVGVNAQQAVADHVLRHAAGRVIRHAGSAQQTGAERLEQIGIQMQTVMIAFRTRSHVCPGAG